MSLNRSEQRVFDYLQSQPEERRHWMDKVAGAVRSERDEAQAVLRLEAELWRYYMERSENVPSFREAARREGPGRVSMKNLAELLIRLWTEPRPKKPAPPRED